MPRRCSVPYCRSNYDSATYYTTVFQLPREANRRAKWMSYINRENFVPGTNAVVCINHFHESDIIREDSVTRDDGTLLVVKRQKPKLTPDAIPSIIPHQSVHLQMETPITKKSELYKKLPYNENKIKTASPGDANSSKQLSCLVVPCRESVHTPNAYLSIIPNHTLAAQSKRKKNPTEDLEESIVRVKRKFLKRCSEEKITSFKELSEKLNGNPIPGWLSLFEEEFVVLYKVTTKTCPRILVSIKIYSDLTVTVWHNDSPVDMKTMEFVLGSEYICDKWTKFNCLINHLNSYQTKNVSIDRKLSAARQLLKECCSASSDSEERDKPNNIKTKFILEQISQLCAKHDHYSPELLTWACNLFFSYPAAYTLMRDTGVLTLPHPVYLMEK